MRSPAALALSSLLLVACGGGDDDGDSDGIAVDSSPLSELTAAELLEMLLDVDGDGSGLDADTIDGVDSDDLARATRRSVDIQPSSLEVDDTDEPILANANARATLRFRIPPDAVPGEPIELDVRATVAAGTPCGLVISGEAIALEGEGEQLTDVTVVGGNTVTVSSIDYFTIRVTIDSEDDSHLEPGTWLFLALYRSGLEGTDTCTAAMGIVGAAVEYQGL
ncbi:MAG TPA: hypothetical protein VMZ28_17405 [Kofleriaceae bacterium]|nr:hypothetical protein [Kofleriaceae bacterium]